MLLFFTAFRPENVESDVMVSLIWALSNQQQFGIPAEELLRVDLRLARRSLGLTRRTNSGIDAAREGDELLADGGAVVGLQGIARAGELHDCGTFRFREARRLGLDLGLDRQILLRVLVGLVQLHTADDLTQIDLPGPQLVDLVSLLVTALGTGDRCDI